MNEEKIKELERRVEMLELFFNFYNGAAKRLEVYLEAVVLPYLRFVERTKRGRY